MVPSEGTSKSHNNSNNLTVLACMSIIFYVPLWRPLHIISFKIQWLKAVVINNISGDNIDRWLFVSFAGGSYYMPLSRIYLEMKKIFFFCRLQIHDKAKPPNNEYILAWEIGDIFEEKVFGSWNLIQELSCITFGSFKNINMCQECSLKLNRKICTCKWL